MADSWPVHCLSALSVDMTALCCPSSHMRCHVAQGALHVAQVHMKRWLLIDNGYDCQQLLHAQYATFQGN